MAIRVRSVLEFPAHGSGLWLQRFPARSPWPYGKRPSPAIWRLVQERRVAGLKARLCVANNVNGRDNVPPAENGRHPGTSGESRSLMLGNLEELDEWETRDMPSYLEDAGSQYSKPKMGNEGEDPYRILENGRKVYLDELDVLTLLDPPHFLVPSDANRYNQAAFLWKKIGDIPEERRHRLLDTLTPKQVANMWDIASEMFDDDTSSRPPDIAASFLLCAESESFLKPVTWIGKAFNVPWPLRLFSRFQKDFFLNSDGSIYGRVLTGWLLQGLTRRFFPLYFEVRDIRKVVATEEPCHIGFEYGDGQLHLLQTPNNFPMPAKHPWPFNDAAFDYVRPVGPGVFVGQWWIEGRDLEKMPQKFADFVMIKDYQGKQV